MTKAVYPGTFDPVTNGHLDITVRASRLFDRVIVAVFEAPPKTPLFSARERVELFRRAVAHLPNVEVYSYNGLTVQYTRQMGAQVIVRGLRMGSDFDYEFEMALMNKEMAPDIEVVFLMTSQEHQFISASLIKEIASHGGNVESFVPLPVAQALKEKLQTKSL